MKKYRRLGGLIVLLALAVVGRSGVPTGASPGGGSLPEAVGESAAPAMQVVLDANLAIAKLDGPDPVGAGEALVYTINVTNAGPVDAAVVIMTDALPAGTSFVEASGSGWVCLFAAGTVTCTRDLLPVGDAPPISITVEAPNAATTLSNTANVTSAMSDPNPANNHATATTAVTGPADLAIATSDEPDPVDAGAALTYTLTVTNLGPDPASGVTVTDALPTTVTFQGASGAGWSCTQAAAIVTCTRETLELGTAPAITVTVAAPAAGGSIANTATVASTSTDPVSANNSATTSTTITAVADISITKADNPDPVDAGENLTYTLTAANAGPSRANGITITDTLPAGVTFQSTSGSGWSCIHASGVVTCTRSNINAGSTRTLTIVVRAPEGNATLTNTASITSTTIDREPADNTDSQQTTVTDGTARADLSIANADGPDPVDARAPLTYTLTVTNLGPDTALGVTVTDDLPGGVTFQSASGAGWNCSPSSDNVTCTRSTLAVGPAPAIAILVAAPANAGSITNKTNVDSASTDPVSANDSATTSTAVSALADLSIAKTDSPDPVVAGAGLVYTLTAANAGPSRATGITVIDTLPAGVMYQSATGSGWTCGHNSGVVTCTRPDIPAASTRPLTLTVTAPSANGTVTNHASITAATPDPDPGDNVATQETTVTQGSTPEADLSLTQSDAPDPVSAIAALVYTLSVVNGGPNPASGVTVTDTLPAGAVFGTAAGSGWQCSHASGVVTCTRTQLAVGAAPPIAVTLVAPSNGGPIANVARVASATSDPSSSNNAETEATNVIGLADLSIQETDAPDPVPMGQRLTAVLAVANAGPSTATAVSVTDTLPAGTTFVSASGSGWSCAHASGTVTCTRQALPVGAAPSIALVVTAPGAGGTITNLSNVSGSETDLDTSDNHAQRSIRILPPSEVHDIAVTKIQAPAKVKLTASAPVKTVRVTVQIQNRGGHKEVVLDRAILSRLVTLSVQSLGSCRPPTPVVTSFSLQRNNKLNVHFNVTFDCANDPLASGGDYLYVASVSRDVIDGEDDVHPADDVCPRSVPPPYVVDPYPNASIRDRGCGKLKPDGTKGAPIMTDVVVP